MDQVSADEVRAVIRYDPATGHFWRLSGRFAGKRADAPQGQGYRRIALGGRRYQAHRVAWLCVHGVWPAEDIDHINGNRSDNRIANLRDVSRAENIQNQRGAQARSKSGLLGVSWCKRNRKWRACLQTGAKSRHLGLFDTPEEAHAAYLAEKRLHHAGCTI